MQMALIDRQAAIDALDEIEAEVADGYGYQYAKWREYFAKMPAVDAVPVVHGHWIDRNGNIVAPFWERYECSVCGARADDYHYCPNCGALMDGKDGNDG